jgi:RNA polymerase sigma-70 factor (ECF subfamily)
VSAKLTRLAVRARDGDRRAFVALYRALHPILYRYARRRVRPEVDVDDVVARAFEKIVRALPSFDPERGSVEAWAVTITKRLVIDHARAKRPTVAIDRVEEGESGWGTPVESIEARDKARALESLLAGCAPEVRRLLALRYGDGLSHKEIAELEGLSHAAVRKRISRALADLRERSQTQAENGAMTYVF